MSFMPLIVPSLILIAGLIDDLRSRKIHNWLVLSCLAVALVYSFVTKDSLGFRLSLLAGGIAIGMTLPLVLLKILGAGDMKLMIAFGVATDYQAVIEVIVYSFFWGALLGIITALLNKDGLQLFKNTLKIATKKEVTQKELHKIPYSVALLFGWLTHVSTQVYGGLL